MFESRSVCDCCAVQKLWTVTVHCRLKYYVFGATTFFLNFSVIISFSWSCCSCYRLVEPHLLDVGPLFCEISVASHSIPHLAYKAKVTY